MFDSVLNTPLLIINKFDLCFSSWTTITFPVDKYLFKVSNSNTRTGCKICSKLTIKIPKLGTYFTCFTLFIVNFEQLNANWGKDYFLTNKIVKRRYERSFCQNYKDPLSATIGTKWGKIFITQRKCCYIFSTRIISGSG